jgi:hypothetical protein
VVLLGIVDVELIGQERVAFGSDLDERVPRGLGERWQDLKLARLGLELNRQRAQVADFRIPRMNRVARRHQLAHMAALADAQLLEQQQRWLVGDRVEVLELVLDRAYQRRLDGAVGELQIALRRRGRGELIQQAAEGKPGGARIFAGMAQLVQAALDPRDGPSIVVKVLAEAQLGLELRHQRQPAAGEVNELAQDVEVVGEPDRVLVDVVPTPQRLVSQRHPATSSTGSESASSAINRRLWRPTTQGSRPPPAETLITAWSEIRVIVPA